MFTHEVLAPFYRDLHSRVKTCQALDSRHLMRHDGGGATQCRQARSGNFVIAEAMQTKPKVLEVPGGSRRSLGLGRRHADSMFEKRRNMKLERAARRRSGRRRGVVDWGIGLAPVPGNWWSGGCG
jgi:hypothetical protein